MSIYLDHAATTPLDQKILEGMMPYFSENFGNPSSLYRQGQRSREAIDDARLNISKNIGCQLDEIIFTSGATESNNLAIKGVIQSWKKNNPNKTPHIISSPLEHSSILSVLEYLVEEKKAEVSYLSVDENGLVDVEEIKTSAQENTVLVCVMAVNNEIGTIQRLSSIGKWCQQNKILFHIDAVQAVGQILVSMDHWKCDMISLSAHKFYGPKGIGLLAIKSGTQIIAQSLGGGHERGYRGGTENVPAIVGMDLALALAEKNREIEVERLRGIQIFAKKFIEEKFSESVWNGAPIGESRATCNINFSLPDISGESLLMRLDLEGVEISLGSACSAGMMKPSHVLTAIGRDESLASTGIRISMGRTTTQDEVTLALEKILEVYTSLREDQEFF